jgi:hypothetical protein
MDNGAHRGTVTGLAAVRVVPDIRTGGQVPLGLESNADIDTLAFTARARASSNPGRGKALARASEKESLATRGERSVVTKAE